MVTVIESPEFFILFNYDTLSVVNSTPFFTDNTVPGSSDLNSFWNFGDNSFEQILHKTSNILFKMKLVYLKFLIVTDNLGCTDTTFLNIFGLLDE